MFLLSFFFLEYIVVLFFFNIDHNVYFMIFCSTDTGDFEPIDITPLSSPPELPDVMKGQEATHDTSAN